MGSKNSDGSNIEQGRKTVRKIGGATTFSSDRSEIDIQTDGVVEPGTGADNITVTYSTTSQGDAIKISSQDGLVTRESEGEEVSLLQSDIDPYANGGGGADILGSISASSGAIITGDGSNWIAQSGNDARTSLGLGNSDIPNFTALTLKSATDEGIRIEVDSNNGMSLVEGDDSGYGPFMTATGFSQSSLFWQLASTGFALGSGGTINWYNGSTLYGSSRDTGIKRSKAGLLRVTDGVSGFGAFNSLRDLEVVTPTPSVTLAASSGQAIIVMGGGWREVKLPSAPVLGLHYDIKDGAGTASSGNIILNANGSTLDGAASGWLDTNYESRTIVYNGTEWNNI